MTDQRPKRGEASVSHQRYVGYMLDQEDLPEPLDKDVQIECFISHRLKHIWPDHPAFRSLVDRIYDEAEIGSLVTMTSPKSVVTATARRKVELASLLWHCYLVFRNKIISNNPSLAIVRNNKRMWPTYTEGHPANPDYVEFTIYPYVKISLNKNSYRVNDSDNPLQITDNIIKILKLLLCHGFVEFEPGWFNRVTNVGKQTRFRPDHKLDVELVKLPNLHQAPLPKPNPSSFRVPLKTGRKKKSGKDDWQDVEVSPICPDLKENAALIDRYNDFIQTQRVHLHGAKRGVLLVPTVGIEYMPVHESNKYIRNVYHIEDDGHFTYGRMHGGFWQNMPSKYRHLIRINGEPVVILDFKAMILSIVASHSGQKLIGDPYEIDVGLGDQHKKVQRSLIKSILIIGINTKSSIEAANAVLNEHAVGYKEAFGRKLTQKAVLGFIDKIVQVHPFLKKYLFKKLGKDIFAIDADIARGIIRRCLDANKLVLPIHDGFVVAASDKDFLRSAMEASWKEFFDTDIGIDEE